MPPGRVSARSRGVEINRLGDEHQMLRTEAGLGRAAMFGCGVKGVVVGVVGVGGGGGGGVVGV